MAYTGRQDLTKLHTLRSDYTFPRVFGALNLNPTSELLHHLRFFKFHNLKVQNTPFFAILRVIPYTGNLKNLRWWRNSEVVSGFSNSRNIEAHYFFCFAYELFLVRLYSQKRQSTQLHWTISPRKKRYLKNLKRFFALLG